MTTALKKFWVSPLWEDDLVNDILMGIVFVLATGIVLIHWMGYETREAFRIAAIYGTVIYLIILRFVRGGAGERVYVAGYGIVSEWWSGWNMFGVLLWPVFMILTTLYYEIWENVPFDTAYRGGAYMGSILYCLITGSTCWTFVKANRAVIYQNIFRPRPQPISDEDITNTLYLPVGLISVLEGFRFIPPWWRIVKPINTTTESELFDVISVLDKDGLDGQISMLANLTPAPGIWLVNFLHFPEKIAKRYLTSMIIGQVQKKFREYRFADMHESAFEKLPELNAWAERELLDGSRKMSIWEKIVGRFTGNIVFFNLVPSESTAALLGVSKRIKTITTAAALLRKEFPDLDPGMIADIAAAQTTKDHDSHIASAVVRNIAGGNAPQSNPYLTAQVAATELRSEGFPGTQTQPPLHQHQRT